MRQNQVGLLRDELLGESRHRFHVAWCPPANIRSDIVAIHPTKLLKFFPEYPKPGLPFRVALGSYHQHADSVRLLLLRPRHERPRRRAAEQRDELAPPHVNHGTP